MKEYIAEAGGRYTYTDDILNLQELSLSITSMFSECSNFIISGCLLSGNDISAGYVWINGKIRWFESAKGITLPYYIYEKNNTDSTTYANDANKRGRNNYLCTGGKSVPTVQDLLTGQPPQFIEITADYAPRFIDKFMGKYALLVDSPFQKQTVKKDVNFTGNLITDKELESKLGMTVSNPASSIKLRNFVYQNGDVTLGVFQGGTLLNEILICNSSDSNKGVFIFRKEGIEQARISDQAIQVNKSRSHTFQTKLAWLYDNHLINAVDTTDDGTININYKGYDGGSTKFRTFNVYDGKSTAIPLFQVEGKTSTIRANGYFTVSNSQPGILLTSTLYGKTDTNYQSAISWADKSGEIIGFIGYNTLDKNDSLYVNRIGNIIIQPVNYVDIKGELWLNGVDITTTFVSGTTFTDELKKKVSIVSGKQLSTEDFTTAYKKKLDAISTGSITGSNEGFVTGNDVHQALSGKLSASSNLNDLESKTTARANLNVYSKSECDLSFLKISNNLLELVNLSADEINGLTPEQSQALKAEKQARVRNNIDAEKKGTGELKLTKASNLNDLPDKTAARRNIEVYSKEEIDKFLQGKLSSTDGYQGAIYTQEHKTKLEAIKTGIFSGVDADGKQIAQVEGYVMTSGIVKELVKKANLLLDGYNDTQKTTIAGNINVYTKVQSDARYATVESLWQDYITFLVKQGKTTQEALKTLRDKLEVYSKTEVTNEFLKRANLLSDMTNIDDEKVKKQLCANIGAAWASEYQTKITDTGWLQMSNSGGSTDTRRLFIRQIGNVVSIQGIVNTAKRDGSNSGGIVAVIPNTISPPKYGLRCSYMDFNDGHSRNRGTTFKILGNSRNIVLYESGMYNVDTELNFTYMT